MATAATGSSPRGRGKHERSFLVVGSEGLIPAWAGKTSPGTNVFMRDPAHPRVGGENQTVYKQLSQWSGSSPRGRGKQQGGPGDRCGRRLIPAWAGKTPGPWSLACSRSAHPRVGGENGGLLEGDVQGQGSSPRGRGKHFLTCAFIERIGQILETLELAVSSESYTLSAAYATDAPQDQARNTALVLPSSRGAS